MLFYMITVADTHLNDPIGGTFLKDALFLCGRAIKPYNTPFSRAERYRKRSRYIGVTSHTLVQGARE